MSLLECQTNHETTGVEFFARDELPVLDTERTTAGQVERMFAHFDDPDRPTDFDEDTSGR